jgi:hypothetical protein
MDPQQELFTAIRSICVNLFSEDNVHDGALPPGDAPYPFVYLGDSDLTDQPNKSAIFGTVTQTINVWHNNPHQRGTVSRMMLQIKQAAHRLQRTDSFSWDFRSTNQRIITDETTAQPLLHGILELEFHFS